MDKVIKTTCFQIAELIEGKDNCDECIFDGDCCRTCEFLKKCPIVCGVVRWELELKNNPEKLIAKLREVGHQENEAAAIASIAADVMEEVSKLIKQVKKMVDDAEIPEGQQGNPFYGVLVGADDIAIIRQLLARFGAAAESEGGADA